MLASVVDDLVTIGRLPRLDFERTKRSSASCAADEPDVALRLAIVASPVNGAGCGALGRLFVRASSWANWPGFSA